MKTYKGNINKEVNNMTCKNCGHDNLPEAKFCNNCGTNLNDNPEQKIENENISNPNNSDTKSKNKTSKTNNNKFVLLLMLAIILFSIIKIYRSLSVPKSSVSKDLSSNTISNENNSTSEITKSAQDVSKENKVDNTNTDFNIKESGNDSIDDRTKVTDVKEVDNTLADGNEDEILSDEEIRIDDYLGKWYITEYGKPEMNDEGRVLTTGTEFELTKENDNYVIRLCTFYGSGATLDITGVLEYRNEQWVADYDDDGWGNNGQITLCFKEGSPYLTATAMGGDEYGLNCNDMECTRSE